MKIHSHYDNLKVSRDAPQEVIRAAYRTLSQKYHPDRRLNDPDAERVMKIINASYAVLSDPAQRKEHDEWLARKEREAAAASAPPRATYASAGASAYASPHHAGPQASAYNAGQARPQSQAQAQPSPQPARRRAHRSGPHPQAGKKPHAAHRKAGFSLRKLSLRGWSVIAVVAFFGYVAFTESMTPWPLTHESGIAYGPRNRVLNDTPSTSDSNQRTNGLGSMQTVEAATPSWARDVSILSGSAAGHQRFVRPNAAPNGLPWPAQADYLDGVPVGAIGGHSSVMIDNSANRFDVYGKLVFTSMASSEPVRQFFIPAGQRLALTDIAPGNYDVRYENLDDGGLYKSQPFGLAEQTASNGVTATSTSVSLYPIDGGSVRPMSIGQNEF